MTKFATVTLRAFPLTNGKIDKSNYVTLTYFREMDKETVGDVLKRAKSDMGEGMRVLIQNPGIESDKERAKRYEETGLEVVTPNKDMVA